MVDLKQAGGGEKKKMERKTAKKLMVVVFAALLVMLVSAGTVSATASDDRDIQAEIRNIWTSDTMSPIVLFGQTANLGEEVQADLDADSFSDSLPNYDSRCLGPKNYDKSIVSRFREGDNKVRIVVDITGGTGYNPGSEGYIRIINPDYKITKIFYSRPYDSDYMGVYPPWHFPDIHTEYYGFGAIVDTEGGSISWQGRGGCPACGCRENALRMEFSVEKVSPSKVYVDIKPGSCPNPLNLKSKGVVLPVAIIGTDEFNVTTIDPDTINLTREGFEDVGVAPIRWSYEDVATPFTGEPCDCHDLNGDGYRDLTLKFDTQELVETLGLNAEAGNRVPLTLTGTLKEENDGTHIEGEDCVSVLK